MEHTKNCRYCGVEFITKNSRRVYCSSLCSGKTYAETDKGKATYRRYRDKVSNLKKALWQYKICPNCMIKFKTPVAKKLFCSRECQLDAYKKSMHIVLETKICKGCGNEFKAERANRLYCSKKCWIACMRKGKTQRRGERVSTCKICDKEFKTIYWHKVFCSDECRRKSIKYRHKHKVSHLQWKVNNPEAYKSHYLARKIPLQPCSVCGNEKAQKHHPDYNEPEKVLFLCDKCHKKEHCNN